MTIAQMTTQQWVFKHYRIFLAKSYTFVPTYILLYLCISPYLCPTKRFLPTQQPWVVLPGPLNQIGLGPVGRDVQWHHHLLPLTALGFTRWKVGRIPGGYGRLVPVFAPEWLDIKCKGKNNICPIGTQSKAVNLWMLVGCQLEVWPFAIIISQELHKRGMYLTPMKPIYINLYIYKL